MSVATSGELSWEAHRRAAVAIVRSQANDAENKANEARVNLVYMDACPPSEDAHPAAVIAEKAVMAERARSVLHYTATAAELNKALAEIADMEGPKE